MIYKNLRYEHSLKKIKLLLDCEEKKVMSICLTKQSKNS